MKKIYAFSIRSYLGPLVLTFFIALFILLMQFLWKYIDDLVGKGLEGTVIAQLLFFASATFVPMALPLAILLSSLMTFGNLGEHYELVAMKAAGISVWKIMRPLVILSVAISMLAFLFSNYVQPYANLKFQSLLYDVRQQKLAFDITEGVFYHGIENYVIRVGKKDKDGRTIYDVKIYDHTDRQGNISVTTAQSGYMEMSSDQQYIIFTLFDGYSYTDIVSERNYRENRPFDRTAFKQQRIRFDLSEFNMNRTKEDLFKSHYTMLNIKQLNKSVDSLDQRLNERKDRFKISFERRFQHFATLDTSLKSMVIAKVSDTKVDTNNIEKKEVQDTTLLKLKWPLIQNFDRTEKSSILDMAITAARSAWDNVIFNKNDFNYQQENIRKHLIAWHKKFTLSIACLILFFIGAPMGAIIRKGGLGLPVVIAVLFFVVYHITSITGEKAAKVGDLNMVTGVWLSSIILFPVGLFLTFKATTDAALLDVDSWRKLTKKLLPHKN
ncbi:MAG: LptF/LptG family permease [Bacteroidales bacterium]|nr:LptF/LptG family permease [Bacteroidales bacterium]